MADPEERTNIAAQHPGLVAALGAKLANYSAYITGWLTSMDKPYNCSKAIAQGWAPFNGPCCVPAANASSSATAGG